MSVVGRDNLVACEVESPCADCSGSFAKVPALKSCMILRDANGA